MTAPQTSQTGGSQAGADPAEIDRLACAATRVTRQAEVTQESQGLLDDLRKRYTAARADYGAARTAATTQLADVRRDLDEARKALEKRHLGQGEKDGVDKAWDAVKKDLDDCVAEEEKHTVAPCSPDATVAENEQPARLAGRVHDYRTQADERTRALEALLTEVAVLPTRVATVRAEVDAVVAAAEVAATPAAETAKNPGPAAVAYAKSLVAGWHLDHVFRGFDGVDDYVDTVCSALSCVLRLWTTIVALEGAQAYATCLAQPTTTDRCSILRDDPLAAVLSRVEN